MPDSKSFDYAGEEGVAYHRRRCLPPEAEKWVSKLRAEKLQPHVKGTDVVLEYGVGFGWNLRNLRCLRKVGFDVAPGLRGALEAHNIAFVDDIELLGSDLYDVVICHHTLEHLNDPADALKVMRKILKEGGFLLLYTPYEIERRYRKYDPNNHAHHLYSWTPRSLANLVEAVGYQIKSVALKKFRFDRIAALVACKLRLGERFYRLLRGLGLLILPEYEIEVIAVKKTGH